LRRSLNEIANDGCAVEARVLSSASEIMDTVTEFMEEGHDFVMLEKRWLVLCWLGEIADKSCGRVSASAIGIEVTRLKREVGSMSILSRTRMKIQVEIADKSTTFSFIIPDTEDLDIFVPSDISSLSGC
jgi:hypothetical protein